MKIRAVRSIGRCWHEQEKFSYTSRNRELGIRVEEALFLIGRRGGKDRAASVLATFLAAFVDWSQVLAADESGLVLCLAPDQRQAKITLDYIEGVFRSSLLLAELIVNRTADSIELPASSEYSPIRPEGETAQNRHRIEKYHARLHALAANRGRCLTRG